MGMFTGLGSRIRMNGDEPYDIDLENMVVWAMKRLRKDDRIIWLLGIVQRVALLRLRDSGKKVDLRMRRKIKRKLNGFDDDRVNADFESGFFLDWPHYESLVDMYQLGRMKDYSFHFREGKRLLPKTAAQILRDHKEMEERLKELAGDERFCSDGKPYLAFEDGWTWFVIEEGVSIQEARAMRHCGNGGGELEDRLLSLREPIHRGDLVFWKPHLTFILTDGVLGEMKGYANGRPESCYHPYVEQLLSQSDVQQVRGGGYLPENNFSFSDLDPAGRKRALESNPELAFDPFGDQGEILIEAENLRWIESSQPNFPPRLAVQVDSSSDWVAFQTPIHSSTRTAWVSHAWCVVHKGIVGPLMLDQEDTPTMLDSSTVALLSHPRLKQFSQGQDPLFRESNWGKALGLGGCCELMQSNPAYFRNSSLNDVWTVAGLSEAYLSVLNDRFDLGFRKASEGIELKCFDSTRAFAKETRNSRYLRVLGRCNSQAVRACLEEPPFDVPWLRLRHTENPSKERSISLILTPEGTEIFFEIMDFQNLCDFQGLVPEIIYRFGLGTAWETRFALAA